MNWEQICADPSLKDLPYKIEQDRQGRIIMSPTKSDHGEYQAVIVAELKRLLPDWIVLVECAIETGDGVKVPDVAAMLKERRLPHRGAASLPIAPDICVEVASESNSVEEYEIKRRLYFEKGCREFWVCGMDGSMKFFDSQELEIARSEICPGFPIVIKL